MNKLFSLIFGTAKSYITNRQKIKSAKQDQEFKIIEAQTYSAIQVIQNNSKSDNDTDFITQQNKKYTFKDEVLTYLFLVPILITNLLPFIKVFSINGDSLQLHTYLAESYEALNLLPQWYFIILFAIVVDVLGFRSFARPFVQKFKAKFL